jgi:hypothetical protein
VVDALLQRFQQCLVVVFQPASTHIDGARGTERDRGREGEGKRGGQRGRERESHANSPKRTTHAETMLLTKNKKLPANLAFQNPYVTFCFSFLLFFNLSANTSRGQAAVYWPFPLLYSPVARASRRNQGKVENVKHVRCMKAWVVMWGGGQKTPRRSVSIPNAVPQIVKIICPFRPQAAAAPCPFPSATCLFRV